MEIGLPPTAWVLPPFALGLSIGFILAVSCLRHWFSVSTTAEGRNLVGSLKRLGFQYLVASIFLTVIAANLLSARLPVEASAQAVKFALWGLPFGLALGVRWMALRGER